MFCEIIEIRRAGLRLAPQNWPSPVVGDLRLTYWDGQRNSLRRTLREVTLWCLQGTQSVPRIRLVDPLLIDILGDAMLYRGHITAASSEGIAEHEQLWIVRPRVDLNGPPLPQFDVRKFAGRLPETPNATS